MKNNAKKTNDINFCFALSEPEFIPTYINDIEIEYVKGK